MLNLLLLNTASSCDNQLIDLLNSYLYVCKLDEGYYTKVHFLVEWLNNWFLSNNAPSAPVECLFSIVGKVFRPASCSLKDDTFEKLYMMIKCNHQIK